MQTTSVGAMLNPPPRHQRRKDARPQEILQAALQLFVEKGYAAAKMEEIARIAGVTRGTPYLYFANKEEIFKALIRDLLLPKLQLGEAMLAEHSGSSAELLRNFLQTWWQQMESAQLCALPKLILAEAGNFPDVANLYHEQFVLPGLTLIRRILQRGMAQGEFRALDIDMACHVITAPMIMLMIDRNSAVPACLDTQEPERYVAVMIDMLLAGIMHDKREAV